MTAENNGRPAANIRSTDAPASSVFWTGRRLCTLGKSTDTSNNPVSSPGRLEACYQGGALADRIEARRPHRR